MNIAAYFFIGMAVLTGLVTLLAIAFPKAAEDETELMKREMKEGQADALEVKRRVVVVGGGNGLIMGFMVAQIFFNAGIAFWLGHLQGSIEE